MSPMTRKKGPHVHTLSQNQCWKALCPHGNGEPVLGVSTSSLRLTAAPRGICYQTLSKTEEGGVQGGEVVVMEHLRNRQDSKSVLILL